VIRNTQAFAAAAVVVVVVVVVAVDVESAVAEEPEFAVALNHFHLGRLH
jgi:hypothetical protein